MIKRIIQLAVAILMIVPPSVSGQIVVGGTNPDPSAALEIRSTGQGVLLPRMSTSQRNAISQPATGLTVFNTSNNCLEANMGTSATPDWVSIQCRTGTITALDCGNALVNGTLVSGRGASAVTFAVNYTDGNGGIHSGQMITSTGVTGLTATLSAGSFESGAGSLSYTVTGTPSSGGTASFVVNIGGQTCTLNLYVCGGCCAKVDANAYKDFICHNLGAANTSADPFTPSWEINGGYWQWGKLTEAAAGPTGPTSTDSNADAINNWSSANAPDGSWSDGSKTANDPCPTGFRVPTNAQWSDILDNNIQTSVGTWTNSNTNYSAGKMIGGGLMLPAGGLREADDGTILSRGNVGEYQSSTVEGVKAWRMRVFNNNASSGPTLGTRTWGCSVRCIAE